MREPKNTIPLDLIRDRLDYNPENGEFTWKSSPRLGFIGRKAGSKRKDGYAVIRLDGYFCLAHRVAWLYHYGCWPKTGIDHINGNPGDNRISNLREAKSSENHWNMKMFKNNTSGYRGVSFDRKNKKWSAEIWHERKKRFLGLFETKEEASEVYEAVRAELFGKFNRAA